MVAIEPGTKADEEAQRSLQRLADGPHLPRLQRRGTGQPSRGWGAASRVIVTAWCAVRLDANVGKPQVAHRETIARRVEGPEQVRAPTGAGAMRLRGHRHGAQRAGAGYSSRTISSAAPSRDYIPAWTTASGRPSTGVLAGYPWSTKVALVDGSAPKVDSSDMAFRSRGFAGLQEAAGNKTGTTEPMMAVGSRRPISGKSWATSTRAADTSRYGAARQRPGDRRHVPLATMFGYATDRVHDAGTRHLQFKHYAGPGSIAGRSSAVRG